MTNLVVDSSVAVKWFIVEPYSVEARRILDGYEDGTLSFLAPDLINAEFGNIIWKKHLFQGLAAADAQNIMDDFRALRLNITATAALLDDAYKIAVAHRRTVYDSLYLALSLRENCRFVTADEKFANAAGSAFPNIVWLAQWRNQS
ncbi:MAG: type II toxin-antitoxin system VapC family toxin [Pyrinomonadaceae bacterium]